MLSTLGFMLYQGIIFVISEDGSDILSTKLSSILFFDNIKFIDFSVVILILEQQKTAKIEKKKIELNSKVRAVEMSKNRLPGNNPHFNGQRSTAPTF